MKLQAAATHIRPFTVNKPGPTHKSDSRCTGYGGVYLCVCGCSGVKLLTDDRERKSAGRLKTEGSRGGTH